MPVMIELDLELQKFDAAVARAAQRHLEKEIKTLRVDTVARPYPFVETGTLRASYAIGAPGAFARSCEQAARAAERSARLYEAFQQVADDLHKTLEIVEPLLWRIQRPWAMFKWGGALTLAIAGAAIWGG